MIMYTCTTKGYNNFSSSQEISSLFAAPDQRISRTTGWENILKSSQHIEVASTLSYFSPYVNTDNNELHALQSTHIQM